MPSGWNVAAVEEWDARRQCEIREIMVATGCSYAEAENAHSVSAALAPTETLWVLGDTFPLRVSFDPAYTFGFSGFVVAKATK